MSMRVQAEFGDRFEAHVAAAPGGWLTASPQALTWWTTDGPGEPIVISDALPGPLTWLSRTGHIGWGAGVLDGTELQWLSADVGRDLLSDVGDLAARSFSMVLGAVSGDESEAFVSYRRPRSRVRGGSDHAELLRQGVVKPDGTVVEIVPPNLPTVVLWGDGELVLGAPGVVRVRRQAEDWQDYSLGDAAAPRSLTRGPDGLLAAGTARGDVVVFDEKGVRRQSWSAHEGPVTALSLAAGVLTSGGIDGMIRTWEGDLPRAESNIGRPVLDLASLGAGQVVAVVGNSGDAVVLLDL